MAITTDWVTKVISVPKADLTLIQASPEIRELNINDFHSWLRDEEDSEEGIPFLPTHNHVAPITIGDLTLARVVEIINSYTVTFEDGQYAVNIKGGNSNIAENTNVNQVSVRPYNSAGLVTSAGIEAIEYDRGVWIDSTSPNTGRLYPTGTLRKPVNNLADAKLIASVRGFNKLYILTDFTFGAIDDIDGYSIEGLNADSVTITVTSGCSTINTEFKQCTLQGTLSGTVLINSDTHIGTLAGLSGHVHSSVLDGTITLAGSEQVDFIACVSGVAGTGTPIIDMGGSGRGLGMRNYAGGIEIQNLSGVEDISLDFTSGHAKIASTVTNGTIVIRGSCRVTDESTGTSIYRTTLDDVIEVKYNKMTIDQVNSKLQLWNKAGTTVMYETTLNDKDLQNIALQGTGPVDRGGFDKL